MPAVPASSTSPIKQNWETMTVHDDDAMTLVEQAIEILRRAHVTAPPAKELGAPLVSAGVAIGMWQLLDELGDNAPTTVIGVLDLINGLIADRGPTWLPTAARSSSGGGLA